jgi:hypothetical protein
MGIRFQVLGQGIRKLGKEVEKVWWGWAFGEGRLGALKQEATKNISSLHKIRFSKVVFFRTSVLPVLGFLIFWAFALHFLCRFRPAFFC